MSLSKEALAYENKYLNNCLKEIKKQITDLSEGLEIEEVNIKEFRKYIWESRGSMDPMEIKSNLMSSELDLYFFQTKANYLNKLYRFKEKFYFGRIDFCEENNTNHTIYIGITHLTKNNKHLIYD